MYALINTDIPLYGTSVLDPIETDATPLFLRAPQARCADGNGTLTHLFFSDDATMIARAKAICSKCRLTSSCLDGALERAEPWGVWGGELVENGRVVANKRPRGRAGVVLRPEPTRGRIGGTRGG